MGKRAGDAGAPATGKVRGRVYAYPAELLAWEAGGDGGTAVATEGEESSTSDSSVDPSPSQDPDAEPLAGGDFSTASPTPSPLALVPAWLKWGMTAGFLALAVLAGRAVFAGHAVAIHHVPRPAAEALYLQGRLYWERRTPESLEKAVDLFTQAIVSDPQFANAYVGLADSYDLLREFSTMPEPEAYKRAYAAAERAVALDANSAEAHATLGFVDFYWKMDIAAANDEFRRALVLEPTRAQTHQWFANILSLQGRGSEALAESDRARELLPGSLPILTDRVRVLWEADRTQDARDLCHQLIQNDPLLAPPHRWLGEFALKDGDFGTFATETQRASQLQTSPALADLAAAARSSLTQGNTAAHTAVLNKVRELAAQGKVTQVVLLGYEGALGDDPGALATLHGMDSAHNLDIIYMRQRVQREALHTNPEYAALLQKVGLPPIS